MTQDLTLDAGLPANIDAEKTLLGATLLDNTAWEEIRQGGLHGTDFFLDSHRRIAKAIAALIKNGHAVDMVTLGNELNARKELEAVGGMSYLFSLTEGLPRRPAIDDYVKIVKDKSVLRQLMTTCSQAISRATEQAETGLEVAADVMSQLDKLTTSSEKKAKPEVVSFIADSVAKANERYRTKTSPRIPTGNGWLDAKMGGILHGYYTIVGARPKVGKSGFGDSAIAFNCMHSRRRVVKLSLEVDRDASLYNLVPYVVDIPNLVCVRQELQTPEQNAMFNQGMEAILDWNLKVYEGNIDCDEACWIIDKETKDGEEVLFVLDHFGLMVEVGKSNLSKIRESYVTESGRIRRKMYGKRAAMLALFQLNEVAREYADKLPRPADIGESKKPLQDCAACILLHRYQDKETLKMTKKANINLALIRGGGASGNVDCDFDTRRLCFNAEAELEMDYYR